MKNVKVFSAPIVVGANKYNVEFECSYYGEISLSLISFDVNVGLKE